MSPRMPWTRGAVVILGALLCVYNVDLYVWARVAHGLNRPEYLQWAALWYVFARVEWIGGRL